MVIAEPLPYHFNGSGSRTVPQSRIGDSDPNQDSKPAKFKAGNGSHCSGSVKKRSRKGFAYCNIVRGKMFSFLVGVAIYV